MTVEADRPASPPAISMTRIQVRVTLMPELRAAFGLAPTVRNSKPSVLRFISHHTPAAQASATRNPALIRRWVPNSSGRCALLSMFGLISWPLAPGFPSSFGFACREAHRDFLMVVALIGQ